MDSSGAAGADLLVTPAIFRLWMIAVFLLILLPAATYLGYRSGRRTYLMRGYDRTPPRSVPGESSAAALLALLGLLIAFTFGFALHWADARRTTLTEEAAALGTAFLRADYLAEPGRTGLQEALLDYARTRYAEPGAVDTRAGMAEQLRKSAEAQARLWPANLAATGGATPPPIQAFVAGGVTEVLDAHTRRIAALSGGIPHVIKIMMLVTACAALYLTGNLTALRGKPLTWRSFFFAALLGSVMILMLDIERASEGFVQVGPGAILTAIGEMEAALQSRAGGQ